MDGIENEYEWLHEAFILGFNPFVQFQEDESVLCGQRWRYRPERQNGKKGIPGHWSCIGRFQFVSKN